MILNLEQFDILMLAMAATAVIVFIALYFIEAGYGKSISKKWGPAINNKLAWILMEAPAFFVMIYLWSQSDRKYETAPVVIALFFLLHYFQRTFIFPLLLKGKSKMPLSIMAMGMFFNTLNGYMQGEWIFFLSSPKFYTEGWLTSPQFIIGAIVFFVGMGINIHSDHVIRTLRNPGDTNHYLPKRGMYRYVTSANYFGEITEWTGFAILSCSIPGSLFVLWTMANLVPRANSIYHRYEKEFGCEFKERPLKRIFPFIY